jgi:hypothetical protein
VNIMLVVTVVAVAVAVAASLALFVAFREERLRSEARVDALRLMAGTRSAEAPLILDEDVASDLAIDDGAAARPMFDGAPQPSPWGQRLAAAIVMLAIAATAGYVLLPRRQAGTSAAVSAAPAAAGAPLELLSLRHSHEEGRLVITGLVQNPRAGAKLTRVVATAFLFGADGTFLASGRAPLDFSTLAAGDESPFVVSVPVTATVARYRIGFRGEDGRVIAHVDRRAAGTLASTGE